MTNSSSETDRTDVALSRTVSHALRHEPWLYELELDEEGWAPVDQLLFALREGSAELASLDRTSLEQRLARSPKKRHEISGDRIRALYGHSVPGKVAKTPADPPAILFHGTAPGVWSLVQDEGLLPMGRQFVHLSVDTGTAKAVGRRKASDALVLQVDARAAASAGVPFYQGNDLVWLADKVPREFVSLAGSDG